MEVIRNDQLDYLNDTEFSVGIISQILVNMSVLKTAISVLVMMRFLSRVDGINMEHPLGCLANIFGFDV